MSAFSTAEAFAQRGHIICALRELREPLRECAARTCAMAARALREPARTCVIAPCAKPARKRCSRNLHFRNKGTRRMQEFAPPCAPGCSSGSSTPCMARIWMMHDDQ